jgi:hypothetical protein
MFELEFTQLSTDFSRSAVPHGARHGGRNRSVISGRLRYGLNRTLNSQEISVSRYNPDENELKALPKHS